MNNFNYYEFQINTVTEKIHEEIDYFEKSEYGNQYPVDEYLIYLKTRIGVNKKEPSFISHYDTSGRRYEMTKMNMDEHGKELDVYVFRKPWTKLKEFHKIMKIKEYVDNLKYSRKCTPKKINENREYLKQELSTGVKDKKFGKNKSEIEYDTEKMMIISISCLEKKKGLYKVDWSD